MSERLNKAIKYATDAHNGQNRKVSDTPYIMHPLEVMTILECMNADEDLLIAGLLHDTVEDTDCTLADIEAEFGPGVAVLVGCNTEDKTKSWQERKQSTIDFLRDADIRTQTLILADKTSNLRSMYLYIFLNGEDGFWENFNAPKEKQRWYYYSMRDALNALQHDKHTELVYREMSELIDAIFTDK